MMSILKGERRVYLHVYAKMLDVLGVSDLVFMSDFANHPDIVHKAELYMRLVSKIDTMPIKPERAPIAIEKIASSSSIASPLT